MKKILYLSCHSILEYDELRLFHELGHYVFSPGAYWFPESGGAGMRSPLPELVYDPDDVALWTRLSQDHSGLDVKNFITKELANRFDIIIVMHIPDWIKNNWENIKHKRVVWRTIGQSVSSVERSMQEYKDQGMEVLRYSPQERNIPGYCGESDLIRFYKDPNEYKEWNGQCKKIITIAQNMKDRDNACNYTFFEETTKPFNRSLIGPGSEVHSFGTGKIDHEDLKRELRNNRAYFYTGTHPASYTLNFIESFMTGIPVVAVGPWIGNASYLRNHDLYEIPSLIEHEKSGFVSDDKLELQLCIKDLMNNESLARYISINARTKAIQYFGKTTIKASWQAYLEK